MLTVARRVTVATMTAARRGETRAVRSMWVRIAETVIVQYKDPSAKLSTKNKQLQLETVVSDASVGVEFEYRASDRGFGNPSLSIRGWR